MKINKLTFFILSFFLSGCSILSGTHFPLSSTTSETQTHVAQQQWQLNYKHEYYSLQVIVERTPDHWQWIMLNNLGQRLATATVTGTTINIEEQQSHPANDLIKELLEAVQCSYWPLPDLEKMGRNNWAFKEQAGHREIYLSGILRATVDYENGNENVSTNSSYWQRNLRYENKKDGFQLVIQSQLLK